MLIATRAKAVKAAVQASSVGRLVRRYGEDRADLLAAVVAFSILFSMFPIILGVLALVGLILRDPLAQARARDLVLGTVPADSALSVLHAIGDASQSAGYLGLISVIGVLWAGASLFWAMEAAFDQIFRVTPRSLLRQSVISVGMMLIFALLVVAELTATAMAHVVGQFAQGLSLLVPEMTSAVAVAGAVLSALVAFILCFAIYYIVPNVHFKFTQVLPGTLFASLALVLLTQMFPLYVAYFAGASPYGAVIGLFFILMTWAYLVALALVIGAEINAMSLPGASKPRRVRKSVAVGRRPGDSPLPSRRRSPASQHTGGEAR